MPDGVLHAPEPARRNADLFRTLVGRGVGRVFCDLSHVPPSLNNAASWPRAVASGKTTTAVASPIAAR